MANTESYSAANNHCDEGTSRRGIYTRYEVVSQRPNIPKQGLFDLTYACNNNCRHCWVVGMASCTDKNEELTFEQIRQIVDDAHLLGCRYWSFIGAEPMLRPDFYQILDYVSRNHSYTLITNGTLITPKIARLLADRPGKIIISIYGATEKVYDHVTRHHGGFMKLMHGIHCLKEAHVPFIAHCVPMQGNSHQWEQMINFTRKLSPYHDINTSIFYLSRDCSERRNAEICRQRLSPAELVELNKNNFFHEEMLHNKFENKKLDSVMNETSSNLLRKCTDHLEKFYINPFGMMSICQSVIDPDFQYNLREGEFREAWEQFLPSLKIKANEEYWNHCGNCDLIEYCPWCPTLAYIERGRYTAPVSYFCEVAKETKQAKKEWQKAHRRFFQVAGITVCITSEISFNEAPFGPRFLTFEVDQPGEDILNFTHSFNLDFFEEQDLGQVLYYDDSHWVISKKNDSWIYRKPEWDSQPGWRRVTIFNEDYTQALTMSPAKHKSLFKQRGYESMSATHTDQIWLTQVLPDRQGILLHSAGVKINGHGLAFAGQSGAGKSTMVELLMQAQEESGLDLEVLCDDRNIVRRWPEGWRLYGTWAHGSVPIVSSADAPLYGIFFLRQDKCTKIEAISDPKLKCQELLPRLVKGVITKDWWRKELDVVEKLIEEIPFYILRFDKSQKIVKLIQSFLAEQGC